MKKILAVLVAASLLLMGIGFGALAEEKGVSIGMCTANFGNSWCAQFVDDFTARAEEYVSGCREQYDLAVSRAVARLNVLAELCLPYAKVGGVFLAMKGALADEEIDEARRGIAQLGGSIERVYKYPIQDAVHKAVVIRKQKPTPPKYPRAFAKIKKSPL